MHDIYNNNSSITTIVEYKRQLSYYNCCRGESLKLPFNTLALKVDVKIPFGNDE